MQKRVRSNISTSYADDSKEKILKFMKEEESITTTSEVAEKFSLSWNTAEKRLLELTIDDKINRIKKAGVNLWTLKH